MIKKIKDKLKHRYEQFLISRLHHHMKKNNYNKIKIVISSDDVEIKLRLG